MCIRFSRFVVFALTNQLGNFFDLNEPNLDFFKNIFLTAFQGQKKPLSHHEDVIGAEIEKKPADEISGLKSWAELYRMLSELV